VLTAEEKQPLLNLVYVILQKCDELRFDGAQRLLGQLEIKLNGQEALSHEAAATLIESIKSAIAGDCHNITLLAISPEQRKYYDNSKLFGEFVNDAFPSASTEIKTAGTCLAMDLNTAAVFHLMRAAEVGLRALAANLGITTVMVRDKTKPIEFAMWGEIIGHIQRNMPTLVQADPQQDKKEKAQFYHGVLLQCEAIKELWRNPVSHSGKTFKEDEAMEVKTHVEGLMRCLASRIKESE
jgi:hypothetical protein